MKNAHLRFWRAAGLACLALLAASLPALSQARPWPDSSGAVLVFSDQLPTWSMSEAQFQFSAAHYVGCQKVTRDAARHLRTYNGSFLILHYRLGQALGYRAPQGACNPTGDYLLIIDGNDWVQEWPGDAVVQPSWFFQYAGSLRVYNCVDGHYLMELNDAPWRAWWSAQVIQQIQDNEDDGLFADSYSIPNYFGSTTFNPNLPDVDETFEAAWAAREHAFTDYVKGQFAGRWKWIPNIGALVVSRDPSDYGNVDGAMVEDFTEWGQENWLDPSDWALQMNRTLALTRADKIVIAQSYPRASDVSERLFILGSFLLVKGAHSYLNMIETGEVEWYPEYAVDLGAATDPLPADVAGYLNGSWDVYVRHFARGMVLVNPTEAARSVTLPGTYNLVVPSGGGLVPSDGTAPGALSYQAVSSVTVPAHGAAVLIAQGGGCSVTCTASAPASGLVNQVLSFTATATPSGCTGSPSYSWTFGDGATGSGASATHAYASASTFGWTLTVTVDGRTCTRTGSVTVAGGVPPPLIWSLAKMGNPFRIVVSGDNLQNGIQVYIGGTLWPQVTWKGTGKIILAGGSALKAAVPKNTSRDFRFVNPDGGETTYTWQWP